MEAAKGQRRPGGESHRVDGGDGVLAKGHDVGVVSHLHALLLQLVDNGATVGVATEEDEDVALLQLAHDRDGGLVGAGRADEGGKARHAAIDQLDTPRAQLDVVDGAVQVAVPLPVGILGAAGQL